MASFDPYDRIVRQMQQPDTPSVPEDPYDRIVREQHGLDDGLLPANSDPGAARDDLVVSRETGHSVPAVAASRDALKEQREREAVDMDELGRLAPRTAEKLRNPETRDAVRDDVPTMSGVEQTVRVIGLLPDALAGGLARTMEMSSLLAAALTGAAGEAAHETLRGKLGRQEALALKEIIQGPAPWLEARAKRFRELASWWTEGRMEGFSPEARSVVSGIESAGMVAPGLVLTAVSGGSFPALVWAGMMAGGAGIGEARRQGESWGRSTSVGLVDAAIEVATETIPVMRLVSDLTGGSGFLKTLAWQLLTEIPQEQLATFGQDMNHWMQLHPEKSESDFWAERPEAAWHTLLATLGGTATQTTMAYGAGAAARFVDDIQAGNRPPIDSRVAADAFMGHLRHQMDQAAITDLVEKAKNSKAFQQDPKAFMALTEDTLGEQTVFIPADSVQTFLQANPKVAEEFQESIPEAAEQLQEALARGADVLVPAHKVIAALAGSETLQGLQPSMRLSPLAKDKQEAQDDLELTVEQMRERQAQNDAHREKAETLEKRWTNEIREAGQAARHARQVAQAYRSMYDAAWARARGEPELLEVVEDAFGRLKIQREGATPVIGEPVEDRPLEQAPADPALQKFIEPSRVKKVVYQGSREGTEEGEALEVMEGVDFWLKGGSAIGNSLSGLGDWFTDSPKVAARFAGRRLADEDIGPAIYPMYIQLRNPLTVSSYEELQQAYQESPARDLTAFAEELEAQGYDGILIERSDTDTGEVREDYVTFRGGQAKSATGNVGTYDPGTSNILRQGALGNIAGIPLRPEIAGVPDPASVSERVAAYRAQKEAAGPGIATEEPFRNQDGSFRRNAQGDITGAPPGVQTEEDIERIVAEAVEKLASPLAQAPDSFWWHEDGGDAIRRITKGDPGLMERVVRITALLSADNQVGGNITGAIKAAYQLAAGEVPAAGRYPNKVRERIEDVLEAENMSLDIPGVSDKILSFYRNLWDATFISDLYENASTMDLWMARFFGYREVARVNYGVQTGTTNRISGAQYRFSNLVTQMVTDRYNEQSGVSLKPRQVQAAAWVYQRNAETYGDEAGAAVVSPAARGTFEVYFARAAQNITVEAAPSRASGLFPEILGAPANIRQQYQREATMLLVDDNGNLQLFDELNLPLGGHFMGSGSYEGAVNPKLIAQVIAGKEEGKYNREQADLAALTLMYIYTQDAVPWMRFDETASGKMVHRGAAVEMSRTPTLEEQEAFLTHLNATLPGIDFTVSGNYLVAMNFRGDNGKPFSGIADRKFMQDIPGIVDSYTGPGADAIVGVQTGLKAESAYHAIEDHHEAGWADEAGAVKALERVIGERGSPALLDWARDRRKAVAELQQDFAQRLGQTTFQQGPRAEAGDGRVVPPVTPDGRVALTHYSRQKGLSVLDPAYNLKGLGIPYAEKRRAQNDPANYVPRVNLGVAVGTRHGYQKERTLGNETYTVSSLRAEDLYDFALDPLGMNQAAAAEAKETGGDRTNIRERMIRDAGFKGYWVEHPSYGMAAAVFEKVAPDSAQNQYGVPNEFVTTPMPRPGMAPQLKVDELVRLSKENAPIVDVAIAKVDAALGVKSGSNFKRPANILSKSQRPSILAAKPWFGVEHVRDAYRFKTVLSDYTQAPEAIATVLAETGAEVVKLDTAKVLDPLKWGWRILALDLRMPNGQLVEYYLPLEEMERAKKERGHQLFEDWRNLDEKSLTKEQRAAYAAALQESQALYQGAWEAAVSRAKSSESAVRAALDQLSASVESSNQEKRSARVSGPTTSPYAQSPVRQTAEKPSVPATKTVPAPSVSTTSDMENLLSQASRVPGIKVFRQGAVEPPQAFYSALERALEGMRQPKAPPAQWMAMIRKAPGVKQEEVDWLGVEEWMAGNKSVTREQLLDFVNANRVEVREVVKGGEARFPKDPSDWRRIGSRDMPEWRGGGTQTELEYGGVRMWVHHDADGDVVSAETDLGIRNERDDRRFYYETIGDAVEAMNELDVGPGRTKYDGYQIPGGENYREVLITLPSKSARMFKVRLPDGRIDAERIRNRATAETLANNYGGEVVEYDDTTHADAGNFVSPHFDEPNIVAHLRMNDRVDDEGRRLLFVEEVQSDWHAQGRKKGYQDTKKLPAGFWLEEVSDTVKKGGMRVQVRDVGGVLLEADSKEEAIQTFWRLRPQPGVVPDAPFKHSWPLMAMKHALRTAVAEGYDAVAWAPGEVQQDRYDLSKQVKSIIAKPFEGGDGWSIAIELKDGGGPVWIERRADDDKALAELIGKDAAEKLIKQGGGLLEGQDLRIGGEWAASLYDRQIPNELNKYAKKWGTRVGTTMLEEFVRGKKVEAWTLPITPKMRESIGTQGQPIFQGPSDQHRGQVVLSPGEVGRGTPVTIELAEHSDLSTLLHEGGHFYLELMRSMATSEGAPAEIRSDWETTLKWLGAEDGNITTPQHERFARGFESYLREGTAPSRGLRRVFRAFRRWLVNIYREQRLLDVQLSDEIRGVFDRMLATEEEIEEVQNNPLFQTDTSFMDLLTKQERQAYVKRVEGAVEKAKEKLLARMLKQKSREAKAWWRDNREEVLKDVDQELDKVPVYRAIGALQEGLGEEKVKLDLKAMREMYGKDIVGKLPRGITGKDGVHPTVAAELFGFSSADEMVAAMRDAPPRKRAREELADIEMVRRHGDILNDGTIEQRAMEAMENEDRGSALLYELQVIARNTDGPVVARWKYERYADQVLASMPMDEAMRPGGFYRAEVKAAKAAGKALAQKDYAKALVEKRRQLVNHLMFRRSTEIRENAQKALKRFKRYARPQKAGKVTVDEDYQQMVQALLSEYNLGPRLSDAKREELTKQALLDWMERKSTDDAAQFIEPDAILNDRRPHFREMSVEEFEGLVDVVDNIWSQGRMRRSILVEGRREDLAEVAGKVSEKIREKPARKKTYQPREGAKGLKYKLENFWYNTIKARTMIRMLDGYDELGVVHDYLMRQVDGAELTKVRRLREAGEEIEGLLTRHYKNPRELKREHHIPEIGASLTFEGILTVALNYGNEQNRQRLLNHTMPDETTRWTDEQVRAIMKRLRKSDWEYVQAVWDYLDTYWPEIAALEKRRTGVTPEKVQADRFEVETADGDTITVDGGYYPISYDERLAPSVADPVSMSMSDILKAGRFGSAQTRRGHTKSRVTQTQMPVRLDMAPMFQHVNQVITDLTMSEAIESSYRVLHHPQVSSAVISVAGRNVHQQLDLWLKDVAVGGVMAEATFDNMLDGLRAGVSVSVMGFKLSTILVQATGVTHSIVRLGPVNFLRGLTKTLGSGNPARINRNVALAFEKSKLLKERSTTFHRDVYDALRIMERAGKIRGIIAKSAFWPIVKMQLMVDVPTWWAGYETGLRKLEGDEAKAVEFADMALTQAQSSGLMKDLSGFERGTTGSTTRLSAMIRLWTTFYSYFNAKLNLAHESVGKTDFKKPRDVGRLATDFALLFWVEAVLGEMLLQRMPDFEDEDDESSALWYHVKLALINIAGTLPILREIAGGMAGFDASPAGLRGLEAVAGAGKEVVGAVGDTYEGEELDWAAIARGLNEAAGIVFKYPAAQINQTLRAMSEAEKGHEVAPIDYLLYRPREVRQ